MQEYMLTYTAWGNITAYIIQFLGESLLTAKQLHRTLMIKGRVDGS